MKAIGMTVAIGRTLRVLSLAGLLAILTTPVMAEEEENLSFDGLVALEESRVYSAYIDPDADFAVFQRVAILEPHVAFRSNWKRDQNRSRTRNVRPTDVERIKDDVAGLFKEVFTEQLENAGFEVVNYADEDVLVLRPAVIDLDINAPDVQRGGRNRTYTANTGAATLFLELFDSLSGDIIGRAADRRAARNGGGFAMQANRVTNRANARREFRVWADKLVEFLDSHYVEAPEDD